MDSNSIVDASPSFNSHSSNNLSDIADRVVQELRINSEINDKIFEFGDDNNQTDNGEEENVNAKLKEVEEDVPNEDEIEFEFPVVCRDSTLFPISNDDVLSKPQISPIYPLFDRSLLLDDDPINSGNGVDSSATESKSARSARLSLSMLFNEEHSASSSSSDADDLDGITPGMYCVWKPQTKPIGKHKKSNSISFENNTSKRWKVRDLLKRSYSDDNYSVGKEAPVVLFTPPVAPKQKINSSEKVKKTEKGGSNNRLPPYLPYRPDQHGLYANFTGSNTNLHRY